MKLNKKILISFFGLALVTASTVPFLVSCSSSPVPIQEYYFSANGKKFTFNNNLTVDPGVVFGGETFTKKPDFDPKNINKQKAIAYFDIIGAFGTWLNGASTSLITLISRSATSKNNTNPINNNSIKNDGLDYALSSYLNSGNSTYRLGLKQMNTSMDLEKEIETNFKPYIEPTKDNVSQLIEVTDAEHPDTSKPENLNIVASGVSLTFSWWRSENPPKISWIGSQKDVDNQNKADFVKNAPNGATPLFEYTLNLNDINFEVSQYSLTTIEGKKYWYPSGTWRIIEKDGTPFGFSGDWATTKKIFDYINDANKIAAGDNPNQNFNDFIRNDSKGQFINTNLSKIIKGE